MTTTGKGAIIAKAEHHIDKTTHHQTTTEPGHSLDSVTTSLQAQYNRKHHYQRTSHQATTGIGIIIDNFAASLLAQQHHDNKRTTYKITIGMLGSSAVIVTTQIYAKTSYQKETQQDQLQEQEQKECPIQASMSKIHSSLESHK